jgi:TPR repeat protein
MNVKLWIPFSPAMIAVLTCLAVAVGGSAMGGDMQSELRHAIDMAEAGDADIMVKLGLAYVRGEGGVEKDLAEAVKWFRLAADAGNMDGIQAMAEVYREGIGVKQDFAKAHHWSKKAAELGSRNDQRKVGHDYMNGRIVPEDHAEAETWFRLAAEQGDADAVLQIGNMAFIRYENDEADTESLAKAFEWYGKAAELGNPTAQFNMGVFYNNGVGREKDFVEAGRWYERAARNGDVSAQYRMGMYYVDGKGRSPDPAQAKKWFTMAAENENESAKAELGKLPPDVQAATDRPFRIDLADLVGAFTENLDEANEKLAYRMLDVVQDLSLYNVNLDSEIGIIDITVKERQLSTLLRLARQKGQGGFAVTTGNGTVYRGFCVGVGDGAVRLEGVRCIGAGNYDRSETDPAPEMTGTGGGAAGSDIAGRWSGRVAGDAEGEISIDIMAGNWEGEYSDIAGGDSYLLVVNRDKGVTLSDEGVQAVISSSAITNNMASFGAEWTDGGDSRVALFSGVIDNGIWEGIVMATENGKVVFQGRFRLERK